MNQPPSGPPSGPQAIWDNIRDFANLKLKYTGTLIVDCMPGLEARADNSAAAIDQFITDLGGAEALLGHGIWQIIVGEEMHISSGAFYFSVHKTLAENIQFFCERLGLPLPDSYRREPDKTQVRRAPASIEITAADLFGSPTEETQTPKPPAPAGVQRWTRLALLGLGGAALAVGVLGVGIALQSYRTNSKRTRDGIEEISPPLVPLKAGPSEITDNCRIHFILETGGYRASCALTRREDLKPVLQFRKRDSLSRTAGAYQADLLFSRGGKTCRTESPINIIPGQTQEIQGAVFTCVEPPPK